MSQGINHNRHRFLGSAAMTIAAANLVMNDSAPAQSRKTDAVSVPTIKPGTKTSFGPLKQIEAGLLKVGYAEEGSDNGCAVVVQSPSTIRIMSAL